VDNTSLLAELQKIDHKTIHCYFIIIIIIDTFAVS